MSGISSIIQSNMDSAMKDFVIEKIEAAMTSVDLDDFSALFSISLQIFLDMFEEYEDFAAKGEFMCGLDPWKPDSNWMSEELDSKWIHIQVEDSKGKRGQIFLVSPSLNDLIDDHHSFSLPDMM